MLFSTGTAWCQWLHRRRKVENIGGGARQGLDLGGGGQGGPNS